MAAGAATIRTCECDNDWQDKRYGRRRRVKNETASGNYRCATCSKLG